MLGIWDFISSFKHYPVYPVNPACPVGAKRRTGVKKEDKI